MTVSFSPISSPVISEPTRTPVDPVVDAVTRAVAATPVAGDGTDARSAAEAVAKALVSSTHLDVSSFHDESTGRYVTRVADRWSGRVLLQTPPEDLLRFLASAPERAAPPTVIDA